MPLHSGDALHSSRGATTATQLALLGVEAAPVSTVGVQGTTGLGAHQGGNTAQRQLQCLLPGPVWRASGWVGATERLYAGTLTLACLALEPIFHRRVRQLQLSLPRGTRIEREVPVVSFGRMFDKVDSCAAVPGVASVTDIVRCTAVCTQEDDLQRGFECLRGAPDFELVQVQNGMADGALRDSYNFHAIVATYAFESGHTWGQISADDDVLARWNARCANEREPEAKRALIAAQHWLASSDMAATKAVIVIEIQWALQRYMNLRKRTQLWRLVASASDAEQLTSDLTEAD